MKQLLLLIFCLAAFSLNAQDIADPSLRKPYRAVVQTGIALQWFDEQFKSFTLSAERPVNLYNHVGVQANFFFPNSDDYYYRSITGDSYEMGVFAKCFFHGRLTGRRSKAYFGPDIRFGQRVYRVRGSFDGATYERKANTFKFMVRLGWQFHLGPAVLELAFPFGIENENFKDDAVSSSSPFNYYLDDARWFVASPGVSLGYGF